MSLVKGPLGILFYFSLDKSFGFGMLSAIGARTDVFVLSGTDVFVNGSIGTVHKDVCPQLTPTNGTVYKDICLLWEKPLLTN